MTVYSGYVTTKCLTTNEAMKPAPPVIMMTFVSARTGNLVEPTKTCDFWAAAVPDIIKLNCFGVC